MKQLNETRIIRLDRRSELIPIASLWFSEKWGVPSEEYVKSMNTSVTEPQSIPKWYVVLSNDNTIIAGAGIIRNDFHDRPDLSPNVCALFVEKSYRQQNIAKCLLDFIQKDLKELGIEKLYLITDHINFYEKLGWRFKTYVKENDGNETRLYETF